MFSVSTCFFVVQLHYLEDCNNENAARNRPAAFSLLRVFSSNDSFFLSLSSSFPRASSAHRQRIHHSAMLPLDCRPNNAPSTLYLSKRWREIAGDRCALLARFFPCWSVAKPGAGTTSADLPNVHQSLKASRRHSIRQSQYVLRMPIQRPSTYSTGAHTTKKK